MKLRNRILSIVMVLAMLLTSVVAFADDAVVDAVADTAVETEVEVVEEDTSTKMPTPTEKLYGKLALLEALGLFEDMNALKLDDAVTRATFASWLEKAANLTGKKPYTTVEFSDVPVEHGQYDAIQNVVDAGYMSGMGGTVFMPSAAISLSDAAVALVRLTGKEAYAQVKGGYPLGYETTARSLGLYDGVKYGVNTTVNVLVMIYNALRSDYLVSDGLSNKGIIYLTGETVLSFFHNIYEIEGTMTANGFTKTYSDVPVHSANSVEIDNVLYDCNNSKLHDLIGRHIQGFYRYNKTGDTRELVSAYADEDDNTIMELESRALSAGGYNLRLVGLTLYYPIDNGAREKKIELAPGFDFIYNNRAVPTRLDTDILVPDGELTFIDSDKDRKYDLVIAKARITEKVTGIDNYKTAIYTETLAIQKTDDTGVMIVKKQDKKTGVISDITIDEIVVGSVATIYRSHDGMYNEIITSEVSEIVTPTQLNEDDIVYVGETEYKFANISAKADIVIGLSTEFYLDIYGRIAYAVKSVNYDYAYGFVFSIKEDFEQEAWTIKMMTAYGEKKYKVYTKVMIDGVSGCLPSALPVQVPLYEIIRYRLDSNECIRSVDTLASVTFDDRNDKLTKNVNQTAVMYNQGGISFGTHAEYMVGRTTFMLSAPTDLTEKQDIKNYKSFLDGGDIGNRTVSIYDWDPESLEVGVIIQHVSGRVTAPTLDRYSATVGVAKKVYRLWEDGEDLLKIDIVNGGEELTLTIADTVPEFQANTIGFGDVVAYTTDTEGRFAAFNIEYNANETSPNRGIVNALYPGFSQDFRAVYGRVLRKYASYTVVEPVNTSGAPALVTLPTSAISDLTLVDMSEKAITSVEKEYYSANVGNAESPSYVYALTYKNGNCQELVVYKY